MRLMDCTYGHDNAGEPLYVTYHFTYNTYKRLTRLRRDTLYPLPAYPFTSLTAQRSEGHLQEFIILPYSK